MSFFSVLRYHHEKQIVFLRKIGLLKGEIVNILHRKDEWKNVVLSKEEKCATETFYKRFYGKKIPLFWHRMYKNYTGKFTEKYLPEYLFSTKLEPVLNPYNIAFPLGNKCFNPQSIFKGCEHIATVPRMLCVNAGGIFWGGEGELLLREDIGTLVSGAGDIIIKPTIESMGGRGVGLFRFDNLKDMYSGKTLEDILLSYSKDFIIQVRVENHESIEKLYPGSVNTLRIITFICENKIHVAPISMRIGTGGRIVDNGGLFIGVSKQGDLYHTAFSKKELRNIWSIQIRT